MALLGRKRPPLSARAECPWNLLTERSRGKGVGGCYVCGSHGWVRPARSAGCVVAFAWAERRGCVARVIRAPGGGGLRPVQRGLSGRALPRPARCLPEARARATGSPYRAPQAVFGACARRVPRAVSRRAACLAPRHWVMRAVGRAGLGTQPLADAAWPSRRARARSAERGGRWRRTCWRSQPPCRDTLRAPAAAPLRVAEGAA